MVLTVGGGWHWLKIVSTSVGPSGLAARELVHESHDNWLLGDLTTLCQLWRVFSVGSAEIVIVYGELESTWDRSCSGLRVISQNLPGGTKENHDISNMVVGFVSVSNPGLTEYEAGIPTLSGVTNSMEHSPSEAVTQVKKFPAFYGARRFITVFTTARHWSLSWARWVQSSSHPVSPYPFSFV
jgi:hypothetical protein